MLPKNIYFSSKEISKSTSECFNKLKITLILNKIPIANSLLTFDISNKQIIYTLQNNSLAPLSLTETNSLELSYSDSRCPTCKKRSSYVKISFEQCDYSDLAIVNLTLSSGG